VAGALTVERLRALDPTAWGLPLSPENARRTWTDAVEAVASADCTSPLPGVAPSRVLLIGSANVYTALLPWMAHLSGRGVPVRVKPARGQAAAIEAMAGCFPGVEVRAWTGGDEAAERAATADVDGVLAFGGATALAAIAERLPPGVAWLPFGPRFGVTVVDRIDARTVLDHALYDGRGCMSPAAVFARHVDLDALADLCADAERQWPRAPLDPADAVAIRTRVALARALGAARVGPAWAALRLPVDRFSPVALPRVVTVHPFETLDEVAGALAPHAHLLGTLASDLPEAASLGPARLRRCLPGALQTPAADGVHEGVPVLELLWGASAPPAPLGIRPRTALAREAP